MKRDTTADSTGYAIRVGLFFAAVFLVMGTQLPYLPVWLDWRGLSATQIGIISSAPLIVRLAVTPAIAFAADRLGDHRLVLIVLAWGGFAMLAMLSFAGGFWPILAVTLLFSLFWTTVMPLTETVAMTGVTSAGLDYGRMRLWGSLSFIFASFAGGFMVGTFGPAAVIWLLLAGGAASVACAHLLPRPKGLGRLQAATSGPRLRLSDALALVRSKLFLVFLATAGLVQGAHAVFYVFGSLHWRAQGISAGWVGTLWAIGIITEIALFAFSGAAVKRAGPVGLLAAGCVAAALRWSVMAFDPPLGVLVPLQVLHGLTYGAAHLGAIHFIARAVPQDQAGTAQALYASITAGLAMGAAMLLAGQLYAGFQGQAYWAMAVMGLASALACWWLSCLWDGGVIGGSSTKSRGIKS